MIALAAFAICFFHVGRVFAESTKSEKTFEFELNYRAATELKALDSGGTKIYIDRVNGILWKWETSDAFQFTLNNPTWESSPAELMAVQDIIGDIKNNTIDSYVALVGRGNSLLDNQKFALLASVGEILGRYSYDYSSDTDYSLRSQYEMFIKLQDSLLTGSQNSLGVCRHIHSHIEGLANDIGMRAATPTVMSTSWRMGDRGDGHAITIAKTPEGTALIDYDTIITTDTGNVEELLGAYQKIQGGIELEHQFYENSDFKYRFITRDGRRILDFLGYDESLSRMKDLMIYNANDFLNLHHRRSRVSRFLQRPKLMLNYSEYETSVELNSLFFVNVGRIRGSSSSPLEEADMLQLGIKGLVYEENKGKLEINASLFYGQLDQDSDEAGDDVWGGLFHIMHSTDREGLNHVLRLSLPSISTGNFNDYSESKYDEVILGGGLSYRFITDAVDIEPYVAAQLPLDITSHSPFIEGYFKEFDTYDGDLQVSEIGTGVRFAFNMRKDLTLSLEPHFINRIWEDELGANLILGNNEWSLYLGGRTTDSDYEFCPNRDRFNVGWNFDIRGWDFRAHYEFENEDYGDKKDYQYFMLSASKKF